MEENSFKMEIQLLIYLTGNKYLLIFLHLELII